MSTWSRATKQPKLDVNFRSLNLHNILTPEILSLIECFLKLIKKTSLPTLLTTFKVRENILQAKFQQISDDAKTMHRWINLTHLWNLQTNHLQQPVAAVVLELT